MIQAPVGLDPVATTKPYYRSTYYFVYRADRGLAVRSLDDTILKRLKIGVNIIGYDYTNTPPAHALGARGIVGLVGFGNFLNPDPKADHPEDIVHAVARDSIDVAVMWGPLAGYWVKRESVPLTMVALPDTDAVSGMRFAFDMAMAVRHRDKALKATLDSVIDRRHGEDAMRPILPTAPDLRWAVSPTAANFPRDSFFYTAWNGRPAKGMPAWNVLLDSAAIQEVYLYVKARSDGWLKPGRPHRLSDLQRKNTSP